MTRRATDSRTVVSINDSRFEIVPGAAVTDFRDGVEAAMRKGGAFVDFTTVTGRPVAVLITPVSRVVLTTENDLMPETGAVLASSSGLRLLEDI